MLLLLFQGNFSAANLISFFISALLVIFLAMPVHECAHGLVACKLGDNTAKNMGRLTLNPLHHIDWMGAAMIMAVGFGWANPVPVNPRNFRNPKGGMALTALAGPVSNLIAAFLVMCIYQVLYNLLSIKILSMSVLIGFFTYFITINISLAVFNFIPIPPLDGSKILAALLPDRIYYKYMAYERYFMFALMLLLVTGVLSTPIAAVSNGILSGMQKLAQLLFAWM